MSSDEGSIADERFEIVITLSKLACMKMTRGISHGADRTEDKRVRECAWTVRKGKASATVLLSYWGGIPSFLNGTYNE
jgi:hypothetical protein